MKTKPKAYVVSKTKDNLENTPTSEQIQEEGANLSDLLTEDEQLQILADIIIHVLLKPVK